MIHQFNEKKKKKKNVCRSHLPDTNDSTSCHSFSLTVLGMTLWLTVSNTPRQYQLQRSHQIQRQRERGRSQLLDTND